MVYEFIATIAAAFSLAGIALVLRHLVKIFFKKQTPKWLTPVFAAIGIFAFQIHQEYNWYEQTVAKLPNNVTVVKTIQTSSWYRPWSYVKPQTVRFMAVENPNTANAVKQVNLYLFERRMQAKAIPQWIDCAQTRRADYVKDISVKDGAKNMEAIQWMPMTKDDPLIKSVCVG